RILKRSHAVEAYQAWKDEQARLAEAARKAEEARKVAPK
ncbi:MAG: hypothetical protein JWR80_2429, partial [Bradyrhizobium sp.]|nr:hypothetical protein [Bradyrhizobium sp.]